MAERCPYVRYNDDPKRLPTGFFCADLGITLSEYHQRPIRNTTCRFTAGTTILCEVDPEGESMVADIPRAPEIIKGVMRP